MKAILQQHKQYLLTGVSYVIPFIACGGILIAASVAYALHFHYLNAHGGPDPSQCPAFVRGMATIGGTAFTLFPAVLAGFIAYGMAGKPGLVPGFIGGFIAGLVGFSAFDPGPLAPADFDMLDANALAPDRKTQATEEDPSTQP